jgi:hypothetical protein
MDQDSVELREIPLNPPRQLAGMPTHLRGTVPEGIHLEPYLLDCRLHSRQRSQVTHCLHRLVGHDKCDYFVI